MALRYTEKEIEDWFNSIQKCKFSGEILQKDIQSNEGCGGDVLLQISIGTNVYNMSAGYVDSSKGICLEDSPLGEGAIYGNNIPEIGNIIYGILNMQNGKIIYEGKENFDTYPEIPLCKGGDIPQFSQNIGIIGIGVLCIIILGIGFFWIKKSLQKSKHKK